MKIALATFIFALGFQVHAKVSAKDTTAGLHLLNYKEFIALDRDDRAAYIEELRLTALRSENEDVNSQSTSAFWMNLLISQARAAAGDSCIYAGYVSQRDSQNHCSAPAGSSGSCGSGQTQCNPLLYGYGPSSGGICTSSRSTPTSDCEQQYQKIPNYKAYQVADQLLGKDMKAKFDAQAAQLSTYCSSANASDQKGLCDKLKSKTDYMKSKIAAAEKRKQDLAKDKDAKAKLAAKAKEDADKAAADKKAADDKLVADKAADDKATGAKAKAASTSNPIEPVSAAKVPAVTNTSIAGSKGAADGTVTPAARNPATTGPTSGTLNPAGQGSPTIAPPDTKGGDVKKNITPGNCLKNKDDYDEKKSSLPSDLQSLDKSPIYYTAHTSQVTSCMQIKLVPSTGKFKLVSATWPPAMFAAPWLGEDDIESICPKAGSSALVVKFQNGEAIDVTFTNGKMHVVSSKGPLDLAKGTAGDYNATAAEVVNTGKAGIWINNKDTGKMAK